jgi:hypothetical protein
MSKESRAAFNGGSLAGESKAPTPVKLDDLDGRSFAERIEAFQARVFCTHYTMKRGERAVESTT